MRILIYALVLFAVFWIGFFACALFSASHEADREREIAEMFRREEEQKCHRC